MSSRREHDEEKEKMILDIISDLHGYFPKLEGGDILIVAGDLTAQDTWKQREVFLEWLNGQNYKKKVFITGNHDYVFQYFDKEDSLNYPSVNYLCDSGTEFEGLKIWGSPWTTKFLDQNPRAMAFVVDTDEELNKKWKLIPSDIDLLVTHSPPYGILDKITKKGDPHVGFLSLRHHVICRIKPKIHAFGHVHEYGGKSRDFGITNFVNASIVNENYKHVYKPIRIIL